LLFQLLKSTLLASSTPSFNSRVVNLTSSAHRYSHVNFDDYNFEHTDYQDIIAYGQAKTATLYMASAIDRYYGAQGLHGLAVHPGTIKTDLMRNMDPSTTEKAMSDPAIVNALKSVGQGAATTVLAAIGKEFEGVGRKYLEDVSQGMPGEDGGSFVAPGYASWAFDTKKEDRLWKDSCTFVRVSIE
jgi:NAD(P)-dependent dehydrogenase (short-subunit alcohol dehydrogenase family)